MTAVESEIVKEGMITIYLQTDSNFPTFEFYKKLGFQNDGEVGDLYKVMK